MFLCFYTYRCRCLRARPHRWYLSVRYRDSRMLGQSARSIWRTCKCFLTIETGRAIVQDGWTLLQTARDEDLGGPANPGTPQQNRQSVNRNVRLYHCIANYIDRNCSIYRDAQSLFPDDGHDVGGIHAARLDGQKVLARSPDDAGTLPQHPGVAKSDREVPLVRTRPRAAMMICSLCDSLLESESS